MISLMTRSIRLLLNTSSASCPFLPFPPGQNLQQAFGHKFQHGLIIFYQQQNVTFHFRLYRHPFTQGICLDRYLFQLGQRPQGIFDQRNRKNERIIFMLESDIACLYEEMPTNVPTEVLCRHRMRRSLFRCLIERFEYLLTNLRRYLITVTGHPHKECLRLSLQFHANRMTGIF